MPPRVDPPQALPKIKPVKLRPDWQAAIEEYTSRPDPRARLFTPEEDAFLVAARKVKMPWAEITARLGVSDNTARNRWRELSKA